MPSFDGELMASFPPISWGKDGCPISFRRDVTDFQKCGLEIRSLSAQHIQATEGIFDRQLFLRRAHVSLGCMGLLAALRPEACARYFLAESQRRALSSNLKELSLTTNAKMSSGTSM
jgi:hypothetical protein